MNDDVLFEQCCFPHFFHHYYFVYFIFWHKKLLSFVDTCLYIGANSRNPKAIKDFVGDKQKAIAVQERRHQEQITKISGLPSEA